MLTYKSALQVPAPAVVEKTNEHSSQKITNKQCGVGCYGVRYDEPHKLLQRTMRCFCFLVHLGGTFPLYIQGTHV